MHRVNNVYMHVTIPVWGLEGVNFCWRSFPSVHLMTVYWLMTLYIMLVKALRRMWLALWNWVTCNQTLQHPLEPSHYHFQKCLQQWLVLFPEEIRANLLRCKQLYLNRHIIVFPYTHHRSKTSQHNIDWISSKSNENEHETRCKPSFCFRRNDKA